MATPFPTDPMSGIRSFVAPRRQALLGFASGLLQGNDWGQGLGLGFERAAMGRQADDAYAQAQKAEQQRQAQINKTAEFLRKQGAADWADAVDAGAISSTDAYKAFLDSKKAADAPKPTASMQEYQYAVSQGYDGTFQQYETEMKKAGATNIDFNQNQGLSAGFADRMAAANAVLDDPAITKAQTDLGQQAMGGLPVVGNFLTSKERQMADQAQRDFVNAILRRESGAVISPSEFDNAAKQYFPQPGDTPQVIEQKRQNRMIAIQGVVRSAGPSYQAPPAMGENGVVDYTVYFGGQ